MNDDRTIWWWALGAFVLAAAGGAWWWWQAQTQPPPVPTAQAPASEQPAPAPTPPQAAEHPIEAAPAALASMGDTAPLPTLADSDSALRAAIASLIGEGALLDFFHMTGIAARFVATVDSLPRGKVATKVLPVRGPGGAFVVEGEADARVIGATNAVRYAAHLRLLEAIDSRRAAGLYVRFYPLLQQAYRELGYPQGNLNDRLVAVIDHMLATPTVEGSIKVVQPKVLYEFADPDLKARSAGQKLLLRMGTANAARVKTRLLEFRRQITAAPPPQ
jgi:hypothetical protein